MRVGVTGNHLHSNYGVGTRECTYTCIHVVQRYGCLKALLAQSAAGAWGEARAPGIAARV